MPSPQLCWNLTTRRYDGRYAQRIFKTRDEAQMVMDRVLTTPDNKSVSLRPVR